MHWINLERIVDCLKEDYLYIAEHATNTEEAILKTKIEEAYAWGKYILEANKEEADLKLKLEEESYGE